MLTCVSYSGGFGLCGSSAGERMYQQYRVCVYLLSARGTYELLILDNSLRLFFSHP